MRISSLAAIAAVVLICAGAAAAAFMLRAKDVEIARLEAVLTECRYSERDARQAIERQNAAVEAVRIDTVVIEKLIRGAERKYVEIREVIVERLKEDASCENQINGIDFALRSFHGVGLRGLRVKNSD